MLEGLVVHDFGRVVEGGDVGVKYDGLRDVHVRFHKYLALLDRRLDLTQLFFVPLVVSGPPLGDRHTVDVQICGCLRIRGGRRLRSGVGTALGRIRSGEESKNICPLNRLPLRIPRHMRMTREDEVDGLCGATASGGATLPRLRDLRFCCARRCRRILMILRCR